MKPYSCVSSELRFIRFFFSFLFQLNFSYFNYITKEIKNHLLKHFKRSSMNIVIWCILPRKCRLYINCNCVAAMNLKSSGRKAPEAAAAVAPPLLEITSTVAKHLSPSALKRKYPCKMLSCNCKCRRMWFYICSIFAYLNVCRFTIGMANWMHIGRCRRPNYVSLYVCFSTYFGIVSLSLSFLRSRLSSFICSFHTAIESQLKLDIQKNNNKLFKRFRVANWRHKL